MPWPWVLDERWTRIMGRRVWRHLFTHETALEVDEEPQVTTGMDS